MPGTRRRMAETDDSPPANAEDSLPVPPDPSGWPAHPSERRDFYHRIRVFPPEVAAWRRHLLRHVQEHPGRFPRAAADRERLSAQVDEGISFLREVARVVAVLYGSPDLGNKPDPTDELVYILLARHTREGAYQQAFDLLKKRFRTWDDLLRARRRQVEKLVYPGGLSGKKTTALYAALGKLRDTFGRCTLEPARDWPDEQLEAFQCCLAA